MIIAAQNGKCGSQRTERRARVAQKQIGSAVGEASACAVHFQTVFGKIFDLNAEFIECFEHTVGIVGFEQGMDFASIVGQGGKQQGAVADAFEPGRATVEAFETGDGEADGFGHGKTSIL